MRDFIDAIIDGAKIMLFVVPFSVSITVLMFWVFEQRIILSALGFIVACIALYAFAMIIFVCVGLANSAFFR